jgi:hypothetical protein
VLARDSTWQLLSPRQMGYRLNQSSRSINKLITYLQKATCWCDACYCALSSFATVQAVLFDPPRSTNYGAASLPAARTKLSALCFLNPLKCKFHFHVFKQKEYVNSGRRGRGIWNYCSEERKETKEKQLEIGVGPRAVPVGGVMVLIGCVRNREPTGCPTTWNTELQAEQRRNSRNIPFRKRLSSKYDIHLFLKLLF